MIDFTLGICCLSRDFPADPRRLGRKWRMRSRFSALSQYQPRALRPPFWIESTWPNGRRALHVRYLKDMAAALSFGKKWSVTFVLYSFTWIVLESFSLQWEPNFASASLKFVWMNLQVLFPRFTARCIRSYVQIKRRRSNETCSWRSWWNRAFPNNRSVRLVTRR